MKVNFIVNDSLAKLPLKVGLISKIANEKFTYVTGHFSERFAFLVSFVLPKLNAQNPERRRKS